MSDGGLGDLTYKDDHRHQTGPGHVTYHVEVEHGRRREDAKIPESDDGPLDPPYLHHPVDKTYVQVAVEPHGKTMDEMDAEAHKNAYDMASATSPHDMVTKTRILHVEAAKPRPLQGKPHPFTEHPDDPSQCVDCNLPESNRHHQDVPHQPRLPQPLAGMGDPGFSISRPDTWSCSKHPHEDSDAWVGQMRHLMHKDGHGYRYDDLVGAHGSYCPFCVHDGDHKNPYWGHDHDGKIAHVLTDWQPTERIFAPTKGGVDPRLFDANRQMLPHVRQTILDMAHNFLRQYGPEWESWARVYLAGSEASEWYGNNDFDILVGINYDTYRNVTGSTLSDADITKSFNQGFKVMWNDEQWHPPFDPDEEWHLTGYVNPNSWDIRRIKPYAAYEVVSGTWFVEPPSEPEGHRFSQSEWYLAEGYAEQIRAYNELPEPHRTRQLQRLWQFLHADRSRAFGPHGTGVFDRGNMVEKYLDQAGLWDVLVRAQYPKTAAVTFPGKHDEQLPLHPDLPVGMDEQGMYKGTPQLPLYRALQLPHPDHLDDVRDHLGKSHEQDQEIARHFVNHAVNGHNDRGHSTTLGIHWSHDKEATSDLADHAHMSDWGSHGDSGHPVMLEADHPGHEHVIDFSDASRERSHPDHHVLHDTVSPHDYHHAMLPEVPVRPGAPMHLRAIHVQKHDGTYHRIPVGLHTQAMTEDDHKAWEAEHGSMEGYKPQSWHDLLHETHSLQRVVEDGNEEREWSGGRGEEEFARENGYQRSNVADFAKHFRERTASAFLPNPTGGHDWHHGTPHDFKSFDDEPPESDDHDDMSWDIEKHDSKHWNTFLGTHWTSLADTAHKFAKGMHHNAYTGNGGTVHTANLAISNPKHFEHESDMDEEAMEHAVSSARFDTHDPHDYHWEHCQDGQCNDLTDHDHDDPIHDEIHEQYRGNEARWLSTHPYKEDIAHAYRAHLESQGHDGVTYGNEMPDEGPVGHTCAITFGNHQIHNHRMTPGKFGRPWKNASRVGFAPCSDDLHPAVTPYSSGGIGHLPGDEHRSVVAMVPVHKMEPYQAHDGRQQPGSGERDRKVIDGIRQDIREGRGINEPIMLEHDPDEHWGAIGEGNHRLAAAREEGISHVPVRVVSRSRRLRSKTLGSHEDSPGRNPRGGAPLHLATNFDNGDFPYTPPDIHPHHFHELAPGGHHAQAAQAAEGPEARLAGKGKPRSSPSRRQGDEGTGGGGSGASQPRGAQQEVGSVGGSYGTGKVHGDYTVHPKVDKDMASLDKPIRQKAADLILQLSGGEKHSSTHPLPKTLPGWHSTHVNSGTLIIHQTNDDGTLHVGGVFKQHAYDQAERRLGYLAQEVYA